jgi:hypothetical protein
MEPHVMYVCLGQDLMLEGEGDKSQQMCVRVCVRPSHFKVGLPNPSMFWQNVLLIPKQCSLSSVQE